MSRRFRFNPRAPRKRGRFLGLTCIQSRPSELKVEMNSDARVMEPSRRRPSELRVEMSSDAGVMEPSCRRPSELRVKMSSDAGVMEPSCRRPSELRVEMIGSSVLPARVPHCMWIEMSLNLGAACSRLEFHTACGSR